MSLVAEIEIDSPVLREALAAVPDMVLDFEEFQTVPEGALKYVVWAHGDDFEAFESGLDEDQTVASRRVLRAVGDRRLYRITLSAAGRAVSTYFAAVEHDIVALEATVADGTVHVRDQVPDREALAGYRDVCRELDIPFRLRRLYEAEQPAGDRMERYGVTDAQRTALVRALEMGYFDRPRETTLSEVAAELGISRQAVSARIRRGQANLLRSTLDGRART